MKRIYETTPKSVNPRMTQAMRRLMVQRYRRQDRPQQQQCKLKHYRKALDSEIEVPLLESIQFPLSVPAFVGSSTSAVPEISVDSLFPKQRGEEQSRKTRIKHRLDGNEFRRRSSPGDGARVCAGEGGVE